MKKSFAVAAMFALVAAASSFAVVATPGVGPTTATVQINGVVLPILSVAVENESVTEEDIQDNGGEIRLGWVQFISNYKSWNVTFESENGGKLVHSDKEVSDVITYSFFAKDEDKVVVSGKLDPKLSNNEMKKTAKFGDKYEMYIKYDANDAAEYLTSGTYSDTITITVASNS